VPKRGSAIAQRRFGGIDLYAHDDAELELKIEVIRSDILATVREHGPLVPSLIRYLASLRAEEQISQRVFSALLGAELRCGHLDAVICESEGGKTFRIIVEADGKLKFGVFLWKSLDMVPRYGKLDISTIRDRLYPGGSKGDWTKAYYLAARLSRIGLADFIDRFSIERNKDAYNAISGIDDPLYSSDLLRLDRDVEGRNN
jgi:hypothetical protein